MAVKTIVVGRVTMAPKSHVRLWWSVSRRKINHHHRRRRRRRLPHRMKNHKLIFSGMASASWELKRMALIKRRYVCALQMLNHLVHLKA